jgi:hypothetical protein
VNLCYVRLSLLYSDVIYYLNCCNTVMRLKCDPARKIVHDSGFPRTPDRLLKFCGTRVQWLEVFKTITSTCGPHYLGGSAIEVRVTAEQCRRNVGRERDDSGSGCVAACGRGQRGSAWGRWPRRSAVRAVAAASCGLPRGDQGNTVAAGPVRQRAR